MYEQCPKCQSNNWSKLQTGNIENKTFFYNKFCNDCHKFSFSYKCTPSGENVEIEGIIIETEEYIVNVDYDKDSTRILESLTGIDMCKFDKALSFLSLTDEYIDNRIKKLILFS